MTRPTVEILAIGTELLSHGRRDTNSVELSERLTREGFRVTRTSTLGDDLEPLAHAFRESAGRAQLVVATGGLGPTGDDRTRDAVARAFDRPLREVPALLEELAAKYRAVGRAMPASNLRQALVPEGAVPLPNPEGSAPGLLLDHGGGVVLVLPGPPVEMRAVLSEDVMARLRGRLRPPAVAVRVVRASGIAESAVEDRIGELYDSVDGVDLTILASAGEVEVRVLARDDEPGRAADAAAALAATIRSRLGDAVSSVDDLPLARAVGERLRAVRLTLSVAESCTGGMLGQQITEAPGSSDYFLGGVVAYANQAKVDLLGVDPAVLEAHGAVSEECARAMAEGARRRFSSHLALSVTGVAGPGGGTPERPVGLVYGALAAPDGIECRRHQLVGGRERVRRWAVARALDHLRRYLDRGGPA